MKRGETYIYAVDGSVYAAVVATSDIIARSMIMEMCPRAEHLEKVAILDYVELGTGLIFPQGKYREG